MYPNYFCSPGFRMPSQRISLGPILCSQHKWRRNKGIKMVKCCMAPNCCYKYGDEPKKSLHRFPRDDYMMLLKGQIIFSLLAFFKTQIGFRSFGPTTYENKQPQQLSQQLSSSLSFFFLLPCANFKDCFTFF